MFCFSVSATEAKYLLKALAISQGLVIVFSSLESVLGTVDMTFFLVIIDFIPFQVFVELFRLDSKYFL